MHGRRHHSMDTQRRDRQHWWTAPGASWWCSALLVALAPVPQPAMGHGLGKSGRGITEDQAALVAQLREEG